eukprot:142336-Prymnesium_polylepis.1
MASMPALTASNGSGCSWTAMERSKPREKSSCGQRLEKLGAHGCIDSTSIAGKDVCAEIEQQMFAM